MKKLHFIEISFDGVNKENRVNLLLCIFIYLMVYAVQVCYFTSG